jgi:uncharacterized protein (TIGR02679 family)
MTPRSVDEARRRLEDPLYRGLWDAARARLERTGLVISNRPIKVDVSGDARAAIAGIVGQSPAGAQPLSIRLDRLDAALSAGAAALGLLDLLERMDGPLVDRRARRAERDALVTTSWESLADHSAVMLHPHLQQWLGGLRSSGSALRVAGSVGGLEPVVRRALDVLAELPADGLPLAVFAADLTGDAHALDRATLLGSLVAGGLRYINPSPDHDEVDTGESDTGPSWRESWARVGVVCDEVSVSVLVLDLDVNGRASGPVSSAILDHRDAGLPLRLTLQQLRAETLHFAPGAIVRTCENPSVVVRASAMLGAGSAPLVCTDGQPNSAVDELLRQMRSSGARLAHHGDFEWGGIRVANYLVERHLAEPWRFSTRDYLESAPLGRVALGEPRGMLSASWDPDLVPAMQADGRRVFEEQVLADLISDLGS